jgi:hypothetical protein
MKKYLIAFPFLLAAVPLLKGQIVEYDFDNSSYTFSGATQPGSGAASTGSDATPVGFANAFGGFPRGDTQTSLSLENFYVENGVSGQAGDYSFRVDTDQMGAASDVGGVSSLARTDTGSVSSLDNLTSFTVTGWFRTADANQFGNFARLVDNRNPTSNTGFLLRNNGTAGVLQLQVGTGSLDSAASYTATEEWVFFAATYDAATEAANLYIGDTSTAVSLVTGGAINQAETDTGVVSQNLAIGNETPSGVRPFNGYLDNIAIYGSKVDDSGVLTLTELEAIRAAAVGATPPSPGGSFGFLTLVPDTTSATATFTLQSTTDLGVGFSLVPGTDITRVEVVGDAVEIEFNTGAVPEVFLRLAAP